MNYFGKYIALFGAFERDNFGDILFLEVSKKLLAPWPTVALSIVSRDMRATGTGSIISASSWFDCCGGFQPHALIVVGGEILTTKLSNAIAMDLDSIHAEKFIAMHPKLRHRVADTMYWQGVPFAYLPDFTKLKETKLGVNSSGGTRLSYLNTDIDYLQDTLKCVDFLSVRDMETFRQLSRLLKATPDLNPDIVALVPELFEREILVAFKELVLNHNLKVQTYVVFQSNSDYISEYGLDLIASKLAGIVGDHNWDLVLQPAGTAPSHDSLDLLEQLKEAVDIRNETDRRIMIQTNRDVWAQVALIAHSACFVGTSLHGRIVATAFGVPRVSLKNSKVAFYTETWEEGIQPAQIGIEILPDAVAEAIKTDPTDLGRVAKNLSIKARGGFSKLRDALEIYDPPENTEEIQGHIEYVKELSLLHECEVLRSRLVEIASDLSHAERKVFALDSILGSRSWKTIEWVKAVVRWPLQKKS